MPSSTVPMAMNRKNTLPKDCNFIQITKIICHFSKKRNKALSFTQIIW